MAKRKRRSGGRGQGVQSRQGNSLESEGPPINTPRLTVRVGSAIWDSMKVLLHVTHVADLGKRMLESVDSDDIICP